VGPGLNRRTLVHELDAAEAALLVARSAPAAGRVYNVSDGQIHRLHDVIEALYQALGRSSPPIRLPIGLARAAARVGDTGLSIFGREERLVSLLDKYTEDVAVRADRIQSELGFRARFDLRSGWQDALRARI
jgi:nucleoside-diphosphate-sugar epimerase